MRCCKLSESWSKAEVVVKQPAPRKYVLKHPLYAKLLKSVFSQNHFRGKTKNIAPLKKDLYVFECTL